MSFIYSILTSLLPPPPSEQKLKDLEAEVEYLEETLKKREKEAVSLREERDLARDKHSQASHHINKAMKNVDSLEKSLQAFVATEERLTRENSELRASADAASRRASVDMAALKLKSDRTRQAYVDTCRALADAIFGAGREPIFLGDSIAPEWGGLAAEEALALRTQNEAMKQALAPFIPWLDSYLKNETDNDKVLIHLGPPPGSVHNLVIRVKEMRALRAAVEKFR